MRRSSFLLLPIALAATPLLASCAKATLAPCPQAQASRRSVSQAPATCPTPSARDEVLVPNLASAADVLFVDGPWLFAISSGAGSSNLGDLGDSGEIRRVDRATGQSTSLTGRRGPFRFLRLAPSLFPYIYWVEELTQQSVHDEDGALSLHDGARAVFRVALPAGAVEPLNASPSCFLVDGDAYYTFLGQAAVDGAEPLRGLFRVDHRSRAAVLLQRTEAPTRCAWSDHDTIAVDAPSGSRRIHLDRHEPPEPSAYPYRVESRGNGFVLTYGPREAVLPYEAAVSGLVVQGNVGYVALRHFGNGTIYRISLLEVTFDGRTPAVELPRLQAFEQGLAVDECFVYYASGGYDVSHSIRRIRRGRTDG